MRLLIVAALFLIISTACGASPMYVALTHRVGSFGWFNYGLSIGEVDYEFILCRFRSAAKGWLVAFGR